KLNQDLLDMVSLPLLEEIKFCSQSSFMNHGNSSYVKITRMHTAQETLSSAIESVVRIVIASQAEFNTLNLASNTIRRHRKSVDSRPQ
ncbi:hypothetical protein V1477_020694, partial [Vespula maculifrons]